MLGSWIWCVSIMVEGNYLRRQWCRTCRRRPGTCAAPRWASPSSGRLPSSHIKVKSWFERQEARGRELVCLWQVATNWLRSLASEAGWLGPPQPYACHCLPRSKPHFRLNYSNSNPPPLVLFHKNFLTDANQYNSWHTSFIVTWFLRSTLLQKSTNLAQNWLDQIPKG